MKTKHFLFLILLSYCYTYSQDSIVYSQSKSVMFSNKYVFFKNGTFKHYFQTDDGQIWYGIGTFIDKGRKRTLKFEDADLNYKREFGLVHYESNFKRVLIRCGKQYKSEDYYCTTRKKNVRFIR